MKKYLPSRVSNRGPFHQQSSALPTELQKPSCIGRQKVFIYCRRLRTSIGRHFFYNYWYTLIVTLDVCTCPGSFQVLSFSQPHCTWVVEKKHKKRESSSWNISNCSYHKRPWFTLERFEQPHLFKRALLKWRKWEASTECHANSTYPTSTSWSLISI